MTDKTVQLPSKNQLLRESRDALDAITNERDEVRWDLAKRIDEALGRAPHMPEPTPSLLCDEIRNIARDAPMLKGTRTRLHAIAHDIENDVAVLIKALRDNAWEYQIPGELILQAANRIEQLARNKPPGNETGSCPHCTEAYRIWKTNATVDSVRVMNQMRDAVAVGMFRRAVQETCAGCGMPGKDRCLFCQTVSCGVCSNCEHAPVTPWPGASPNKGNPPDSRGRQ